MAVGAAAHALCHGLHKLMACMAPHVRAALMGNGNGMHGVTYYGSWPVLPLRYAQPSACPNVQNVQTSNLLSPWWVSAITVTRHQSA